MHIFKVIWNNEEVGQLIDPMPNMWYLEGDWKSNETNGSVEFERLMRSLQAKQVMTDITKGLEIILRNTTDLDAVGICLYENTLVVRRMTRKLSEIKTARKRSVMDKLFNLFRTK